MRLTTEAKAELRAELTTVSYKAALALNCWVALNSQVDLVGIHCWSSDPWLRDHASVLCEDLTLAAAKALGEAYEFLDELDLLMFQAANGRIDVFPRYEVDDPDVFGPVWGPEGLPLVVKGDRSDGFLFVPYQPSIDAFVEAVAAAEAAEVK